jgi:outer membrane protein assembly factor BamB
MRDGVATMIAPTTWPGTLTKRWQVPAGAGHSSPVIAGDRVVVHARQGAREVTRALDLATGRELWRSDYDAPYTMNPAATAHGPGPKSTPTIAAGRVFTFGISGILSAHDLDTGKLLWRTPKPATPPDFGVAMSPLVEGSLVVAHGSANEGGLAAFDAASGTVRWRWTGDGPAYASPIAADIAGQRHVITQTQRSVIGVNPADGQLLWRIPFTTSYEQNSVTPVLLRDTVVYAGLDNPTTLARVVRQGSGWTTQPVWRNEQAPMYMSTPVVSGTTLFGLSHRNRGQFVALDLATGRTLWTTPGREGDNASLAIAGDYLLVTTTNGELIVARPSAARFEEVRRYRVAESAVWAHPAFARGAVVVKDVDGVICWSF